jgi:hypothetical protein
MSKSFYGFHPTPFLLLFYKCLLNSLIVDFKEHVRYSCNDYLITPNLFQWLFDFNGMHTKNSGTTPMVALTNEIQVLFTSCTLAF